MEMDTNIYPHEKEDREGSGGAMSEKEPNVLNWLPLI